MKRLFILLFVLFVTAGVASAETADFEDLTLAPNSYWNGSDGSGGFTSGDINFNNNYNSDWNSWDGFAYSNLTDTEAEGFDAQYNAIPGSGANNSETYAVVYWSSFATEPPTITLAEEQVVTGAYFTNSNYGYYSMLNGDDFAKQFGPDDYLKITINGYDKNGVEKDAQIVVNLAQNGNIVDTWKWVDFTGLGAVKEVTFSMSSSDTGDYGINTPTYFAMDNFNGTAPASDDDGGSDSSTCFINAAGTSFFGTAR